MTGLVPGMTKSGQNLRRMHMLGAEAHADQPRRKPPQKREPVEQREHEGRARLRGHAEHIADDALLHEELHRLSHLGRPLAALLHLGQQLLSHESRAQRLGKNIGSGDGILNGEVDADAADRGHGVGRIADAEQPRPAPALETVDAHREQLHVVPRADPIHPVGERRIERYEVRAEGLDSLGAQRLEAAFRDDIGALPVIASVEHDEEPARLDAAERLRAVAGPLREPQP